MKDFSSFIDGRLNIPNQQTIGEQSASQIKFNPRTGEPEFRFFQAGFMDVVQAVKSAHGRQKKWQEMAT